MRRAGGRPGWPRRCSSPRRCPGRCRPKLQGGRERGGHLCGKLLVVTTNNANGGKPALFRCNLDGTGCVYTDLSAGQGAGSGFFPSAGIDTAGGKLLVVTTNNANGGKPALFRCNLDGTGCVYTDLSAGQDAGSGFFPSAVMDTVGRQAALCHGQPCRCVGCLALHGMPVASPPVGPTLTMRLESMTSLSSAAVDTCSVVAFAWLNRGQ